MQSDTPSGGDDRVEVLIYVIMPFSGTQPSRTETYWTEHYNHFVRATLESITSADPVLNQWRWRVERSSIDRGGPLNYEIVWSLFWADVVLADLTDLNPNVMYELGIRHAFAGVREATRTVLCQDESAFCLPFDFANYAVIKYSPGREHTWREQLTRRLRNCVEGFGYRDNPVSMSFAQHNFSVARMLATLGKPDALKQIEGALSMIQRLLEMGISTEFVERMIEAGMSGRGFSQAPGEAAARALDLDSGPNASGQNSGRSDG